MTKRREFVSQRRNVVKYTVCHQCSKKDFHMRIQANVRVVGIWTRKQIKEKEVQYFFYYKAKYEKMFIDNSIQRDNEHSACL